MNHDTKPSRFARTALPLCAALVLACSGAEDPGADVPAYSGTPPGTTFTPAPGTAGNDPPEPGAPPQAGVNPSPTQPAGNGSEMPVTSGGTPLEPGDGNGQVPPGDGTEPPPPGPQNPDPQNPEPQNPEPQNPEPQNPDPQNPEPQNPEPQNPEPQNPEPQNPEPQNPDVPPPVNPPPRNDGVTGTPNLFTLLNGRSQAEVDQKVQTAVNRFFGIGTNDPAVPTLNGGARSFYTLPQDPSMSFVYAADSADIRSEGMSYGMFIAVQMDMQEQFDQLWRFARTFMQQPANAELTAWRRYFRWTGRVDTSNPNSWQVNYNANEPPASDGEEYFAVALYLADRRWGSNGAINYEQDADTLASAMLHNTPGDARFPLFHATENMVVFVPFGTSNEFSDPSYHLPAFYEIFAQDGPAEDAARWLEIAEISRQYFVDSAHPQTGLHPDYANFDGSPSQGFEASNHDTFRFDAWRVPLNMAVDFAWSGEDQRLRTQIEKYHAFFNGNVTNSLFNLNGSGGSNGAAPALISTLAAGALASNAASRTAYVNSLWNAAQPTGNFRYYNGAVYLLGLLATAGYFDFAFPQ